MKSIFKLLSSTLLITMLFFGTSCGQEHRRGSSEEDGTQLKKSQTYNETKYGVQLVLKYDEAKKAFVGTVENKSKKVAERTRVEVHLSNGTELGPTTPKNLKPGEKANVTLSTKGKEFKTWSTHAEVGSREHGEGSEGHEGNEKGEHGGKKEGRSEGGEGHEGRENSEGSAGHEEGEGHAEGGGHEEGGDTPNDGAESGDTNRSLITSVNDSYKGVILGLEVNMSYNSAKMTLEGTVKNVSSETKRYIQNEPHIILGKKTVGELGPEKLGHLKPGESTKTSIKLKEDPKFRNVKFDGYFVHIEVGDTAYPTHEGGEGVGNHAEGAGHTEGAGHEGTREGHEEGRERGSKKEGKREHR